MSGADHMNIEWEKVGDDWKLFRLINDRHMSVEILNYGGVITKSSSPTERESRENVVLGYKAPPGL